MYRSKSRINLYFVLKLICIFSVPILATPYIMFDFLYPITQVFHYYVWSSSMQCSTVE